MNLTGAATPTAGTTYDQISVVGATTLNASTSLLSVTTASSSGLAVNQVFGIALNDGTDAVASTFKNLAQGATVTDNLGDTFVISYVANLDGGTAGNDVSLTLSSVAVPEPATWVAGGLLVGLLSLSQRRKISAAFRMETRRF